MDYVLSMESDGYSGEMRYPADKPYALREQCVRPPEETQMVVLSDIVDVLTEMKEEYESLIRKANDLYDEADTLNRENENYFEYLNDIVEQASQLDHVMVDWNGDTGMVSISISDYWYEVEDASNDAD